MRHYFLLLFSILGLVSNCQITFQKKINFPVSYLENSFPGEIMLFGESNGSLGAMKYDVWGNYQWGKTVKTAKGLLLYNSERSIFRNVHFLICSYDQAQRAYIRMDSAANISGIVFSPQLAGWPLSFHEDKNRNMYMVMTHDSDMFFGDAAIVKTDPNFSVTWSVLLDLPQIYGETHPSASCMTRDGSILVAGAIMSTFFLTKISPQGTLVWDRCYSFTNPPCNSMYPVTVLETSSKDIIMDGNFYDNDFHHAFLKFDSTGLIQFAQTLNHPGTVQTQAESLIETGNGDYLLKGSQNWGDTCYLVKMNPAGNILWGQQYLNNVTPLGTYCNQTIVEDQNQDLVQLFSTSSQERVLSKTDPGGSINCYAQSASFNTMTLTTSPIIRPLKVLPLTLPNGLITFTVSALYVSDSILCAPTAVAELEKPEAVQAFPNPATEKIMFQSKYKVRSIEIFNCEGEMSQRQDLYRDMVILDLRGQVPGIYFYSLILETGERLTGKFIVE